MLYALPHLPPAGGTLYALGEGKEFAFCHYVLIQRLLEDFCRLGKHAGGACLQAKEAQRDRCHGAAVTDEVSPSRKREADSHIAPPPVPPNKSSACARTLQQEVTQHGQQ